MTIWDKSEIQYSKQEHTKKMNRNFTEINNSSAIDAGLISLLKTNRYGTPGAFFCDLFESRTKLDTLRSLNQENTPQAKRISGLLENLNSIEAYALVRLPSF